MMQVVEVVWRHLLVGARDGRRRWPSVTALAQELGVAVSTTHRSLAHPVEIGAVDIGPIDGLVVLDPARLLVLLAAHRHVQRDLVRRWWVAAPVAEVEAAARSGKVVLGGFGAVVAHLGVNRVADYTRVLFYGDPKLPRLRAAPEGKGTEVWVAEPESLAEPVRAGHPPGPGLCRPVLHAGLASRPIYRATRPQDGRHV